MGVIAALIVSIALEVGVDPDLALSVALEENAALDTEAINVNPDGTEDRGVMQLNSSWFTGEWRDPVTNIRAGCGLLKELLDKPDLNVFQAIIAYNSGYTGFKNGPPQSSVAYAARVFRRWNEYRRYKF
ncbi:MAG: transglycosylase SLT domain-containing protein [Treponema sp.]|nr:transglycosylase SLT domain-containing protein [Treponema sp.]